MKDFKKGDIVIYDGEICIVVEYWKQHTPSPSVDMLIKDSDGDIIPINHRELESDYTD